eukprot:ANDGO_01733.mRNA.1 Fidgetin-like protein 1
MSGSLLSQWLSARFHVSKLHADVVSPPHGNRRTEKTASSSPILASSSSPTAEKDAQKSECDKLGSLVACLDATFELQSKLPVHSRLQWDLEAAICAFYARHRVHKLLQSLPESQNTEKVNCTQELWSEFAALIASIPQNARPGVSSSTFATKPPSAKAAISKPAIVSPATDRTLGFPPADLASAGESAARLPDRASSFSAAPAARFGPPLIVGKPPSLDLTSNSVRPVVSAVGVSVRAPPGAASGSPLLSAPERKHVMTQTTDTYPPVLQASNVGNSHAGGARFGKGNEQNERMEEDAGALQSGTSFKTALSCLSSDVRSKLGSAKPPASSNSSLRPSSCSSSSAAAAAVAPSSASSNREHFATSGSRGAACAESVTSKTLGSRRFVAPRKSDEPDEPPAKKMLKRALPGLDEGSNQQSKDGPSDWPMIESYFGSLDELPERLRVLDPRMIELILSEVVDKTPQVSWDDIAGLVFAKQCVKEIVVWPMLRPDIFKGLRGPPRGLLLFGPPGTGKTLIGKAIASESGARFFSISASSLMSKWVGEGEKMVRTLMAVAHSLQPSVVFIDEIDSLLSQRSEGDMESSRRVKTEFLVQLDGVGSSSGGNGEDRVLVIGATNRPQELDEAARRRLVKRLYIPLPDDDARRQLVRRLFRSQSNDLKDTDWDSVVQRSIGYSGADIRALCAEAALGPIRSLPMGDIATVNADEVRPVSMCDFVAAFKQVRASVSQKDLVGYKEWNEQFGSFPQQDIN